VISALFSNQALSTINIMKIAVCRMHFEPKMPRAVKRVLIYLLFNKPNRLPAVLDIMLLAAVG